MMPGERGLPPDRYQEEMHRFGFDLPIWQQYLAYLGRFLTGDFGTSFSTKRPVWTEFFTLFPATMELSLCAIVLDVAPSFYPAMSRVGPVMPPERQG